jgi:hypothetical protein
LIDAMVLSTFTVSCLFAASPTSLSPFFVMATIDGVVRLPSAFGMIVACSPSRTATQLFVVPKSIPITLLMYDLLFYPDEDIYTDISCIV